MARKLLREISGAPLAALAGEQGGVHEPVPVPR
jgi:hypothetical protein